MDGVPEAAALTAPALVPATLPIAIDAMGGDRAPREPVLGAVRAAELLPNTRFLLVGLTSAIEEVLVTAPQVPSNLEIVHASEVVGMAEKPAIALRKKRDSSIAVCVRLCKEGAAAGFFSAGNTGAVVAGTMFGWGRLKGIERPGIAVTLPTLHGDVVLCDAGANVSCKALHLLHYAVMASTYVKLVKGIPEPKVGLLSIGEEEEKGNDLIKQTLALFQESELSCGAVPVEGSDIFAGEFDVIVCEGFLGNVTLKTAEGLAHTLITMAAQFLQEEIRDPESLPGVQRTIRRMIQRTDYAETGGAPLLGVDGNCIIGHGRSDARAISNGIQVVEKVARKQVNKTILDELAECALPLPEV